MKTKTSLLIFLILISTVIRSQDRELHIPTDEDGKPKSSYLAKVEFSKSIGLNPINTSDNIYYCRLWIYRQVIDVWVKPTNEVSGSITSWTQEYDHIKEERTGNYFYKSHVLDSNRTRQILSLIDSLKIDNIPNIHFTGRFRSNADGTDYLIETANEAEYNYRTYWTPAVTDSTSESLIIKTFIDEASRLANASKNWDRFARVISYKCYTNGGAIACTYTKEEYEMLNKTE